MVSPSKFLESIFFQKCVDGIKIQTLYSNSAMNFASNGMCGYRIFIDLLDLKRENDNCVGVIEKSSEINERLLLLFTNRYHSTRNLTLN